MKTGLIIYKKELPYFSNGVAAGTSDFGSRRPFQVSDTLKILDSYVCRIFFSHVILVRRIAMRLDSRMNFSANIHDAFQSAANIERNDAMAAGNAASQVTPK